MELTLENVQRLFGVTNGDRYALGTRIFAENDGIRIMDDCADASMIGIICRVALQLGLHHSQIHDQSSMETNGGGTFTGTWTDLMIDTKFLFEAKE